MIVVALLLIGAALLACYLSTGRAPVRAHVSERWLRDHIYSDGKGGRFHVD